jgi:3-oxoacyl-[acyl-carrier-protein] synthase-3
MKILSVASSIPKNFVENTEVETRLGLAPGWIERRTGILRRPTALPSEATSDLAVTAGAEAIRRAGVTAATEIGLVLLATSTPDHLLPPTAPLVAHRLGVSAAGAIDIAGACAGFLYALVLASAWANTCSRCVLVIGANVLTKRVNPADASTVALFGDGAGAVVVSPHAPSSILASRLESDGSSYDLIGIPAGGSRQPLTPELLGEGANLMFMTRGSALFKHAVHAMADIGNSVMQQAGVQSSELDLWVPHQANTRILEDAGRLLGIDAGRTINIVATHANSSAATIPIALDHALESGRLRRGHLVLLTAAGAGMLSAGVVLRW